MWVYTLMLPSIGKSGWWGDGLRRRRALGAGLAQVPEQLLGLDAARPLDPLAVLEPAAQRRAVRGPFAEPRAGRGRGQPGLAVRGCRARGGPGPARVLARAGAGGGTCRHCWRASSALHGPIGCWPNTRPRVAWPPTCRCLPMRRPCSSRSSNWPARSAAPRRAWSCPRCVQEESLGLDDVLRILDEASQLRRYSQELEAQRQRLEQATAQLRAANERLESLDRLKDDFMSSVTHELRTPLTSIPRPGRTDGRRCRHARRAAPGVPAHRGRRDRTLEPGWSTRCWTWPRSSRATPEWHDSELDVAAVLRQAVHSFQGNAARARHRAAAVVARGRAATADPRRRGPPGAGAAETCCPMPRSSPPAGKGPDRRPAAGGPGCADGGGAGTTAPAYRRPSAN
jgi:hypothetical protein